MNIYDWELIGFFSDVIKEKLFFLRKTQYDFQEQGRKWDIVNHIKTLANTAVSLVS